MTLQRPATARRAIDPHGLRDGADALDRIAARIELLGSVAGAAAGGVAQEVRAVAADLRHRVATALAPTLGEAGLSSRGASTMGPSTSEPLWMSQPPGSADGIALWTLTAATLDAPSWSAWRRGHRASGRRTRTPEGWIRLVAGESPRRVRRIVGDADAASLLGLARRAPAMVASTDGMPFAVRAVASRRLVLRHRDDLEREVRATARALAEMRRGEVPLHAPDGLDRLADRHLEATRWAEPTRRLVAFDPTDDGRAIEIFGSLERAERVVVLVPGMGNDLAGFSFGGPGERGGFRTYAQRLHASIDPSLRETTAVIAWLGYDAPDHLLAASRVTAADAGADALRRFIAGIEGIEDRHVTVIGHSYGSVVAGTAATRGLDVDDLVFVGSPGTRLPDASNARLRPGGRVWAGLADADPIAHAVDPLALLGSLAPGSSIDGPLPRIHGPSPVDPAFGSVVFDTGTARGHSGYFTAAGVVPLAGVATGRRRAARTGTPDLADASRRRTASDEAPPR